MLLQIISKFRKPGNKRAFVQSVRSPELGDNATPAPPPHPRDRLQPHERTRGTAEWGGGGGGAAAPHCRWDGARAVPAGSPRSVPAVGSRSRAGWCSGHGRVGGDEDTLGAVPRGSASRSRPHRAAGLGLGGGSLSQGAAGAPRAARPLPRFSGGRCHLWKTPGIHRAAGAAPGSVAVPCGTPGDEPRPRPPSPRAPRPLRAGPEGGGRGSASG